MRREHYRSFGLSEINRIHSGHSAPLIAFIGDRFCQAFVMRRNESNHFFILLWNELFSTSVTTTLISRDISVVVTEVLNKSIELSHLMVS